MRELPVVERAVTLADYVPEDQEDKLLVLEDMAYFLPEVSGDRFEKRSRVMDTTSRRIPTPRSWLTSWPTSTTVISRTPFGVQSPRPRVPTRSLS